MRAIVVNLVAVLFWVISAVLWWISAPADATPESLAVEAYYGKWAAVAACIAAALQVIGASMGAWRAGRR